MPAHWEEKRLKSLFRKRNESFSPNESLQVLSLLKDVGVIPYSEKGNIGNKSKEDITTYNVARKGDIVMNSMNVIIGSVDITQYDGYISPAYYALYSNNGVSTEYYNYLFHLKAVQQQMRSLANGILEIRLRISSTKLFGMYYPFPPIEEQRKIVTYLDKKITLIETCKCQRERELQTLNELKQAEIASVVTRGLNPNVPMKDSGIPWIGQIPEHWNLKTLRAYLRLISEKNHPDATLLSVTREQGVIVRDVESKEENHNFIPEDLSGYKYVRKGQFVINKMKAWQGSYGVSLYDGIVSPAYYVCDLDFPNKEYFSLAIRSKTYVDFFARWSKGIRVGQWDLEPIALKSVPFLEPPVKEMREIVDYVKSKTQKIDTMIEALTAEIERLTEYKQRLISDVVTGQVDVRGEEIA